MTYIKLPATGGGSGGTSSDIANVSTVPGATVTQALDNANSTINNVINVQTVTQYIPEALITLSATDITNKYVILAIAPTIKNLTQLMVSGAGAPFIYGTDFIVTTDDSGKRLSWAGLGLDGVLAEGDILIIIHN